MEEKNDIMQYKNILPEDFDGTFRFTNFSKEDFVGKWGGREYHFPAESTAPIIMTDQTPLEIQQIRKKFAKDLAEREYMKSDSFSKLKLQERNSDGTPRLNSIKQAGTYSMNELTSYIQRCLEPLPISRSRVTQSPKENIQDKLSRNEKGELNTEIIDEKTSLRERALNAK